MKKQDSKLLDILPLIFILLLALVLRLYKIDTPLADLHSWRQADTAAVARNFVRDGIDLLHPRYDDLSGREAGRENPQGYRMVEFPLYNSLVAYAYKFLPILSLEVYGRLTSIFFSLIIIAIIYFLLLKEASRLSAVLAGTFYAVFPFFVFFSRVILPETTAVALMFISILFLYLYSHKNVWRLKESAYFIFSLIFFSLSLLVKPTVIFYAVVLAYLFLKKDGLKSARKITSYIYFMLGLIPFILWRLYIKNFPEGIPVSDWLITSVNTYEGLKSIFLRPAFFRWIFFERINNLILGGYATFFFCVGLIRKPRRYFFHSFLLSGLIYLLVFEGGNVQHEYYQILILPPLAMFSGLGIEFILIKTKTLFQPLITYMTIISVTIFSLLFSFYKVKDYYNFPQDLPQIAKIIETLTHKEDKIVTDTTGDTTLLYLSKRRGAPALYKDPATLGRLGYVYMIIFNKDYTKDLKSKNFVTIFENDNFAIFKL